MPPQLINLEPICVAAKITSPRPLFERKRPEGNSLNRNEVGSTRYRLLNLCNDSDLVKLDGSTNVYFALRKDEERGSARYGRTVSFSRSRSPILRRKGPLRMKRPRLRSGETVRH